MEEVGIESLLSNISLETFVGEFSLESLRLNLGVRILIRVRDCVLMRSLLES